MSKSLGNVLDPRDIITGVELQVRVKTWRGMGCMGEGGSLREGASRGVGVSGWTLLGQGLRLRPVIHPRCCKKN